MRPTKLTNFLSANDMLKLVNIYKINPCLCDTQTVKFYVFALLPKITANDRKVPELHMSQLAHPLLPIR